MTRKKERTISKLIRFTPQEIETIKQKANGLNFSEYVRASALHRQNLKFPFKRELIFELSKQGTNLNQIAKLLNQRKTPTDLAILEAIDLTFEKINEIYEFISKQETELE